MWGIIGGSGFEKFDEFEALESLPRETPFGKCSEGLKKGKVSGKEVVFLPRHGRGHHISPSEINFPSSMMPRCEHILSASSKTWEE